MADNTVNTVQVSFRVTPAIRRALDLKLADTGREQTELMNALIADYLGGTRNPEKLTPVRNPRNAKWHELLEVVLEQGTSNQKIWLTGNLQTFAENIQMKSELAEKRTLRKQAGK